jgi:hypothetical protein
MCVAQHRLTAELLWRSALGVRLPVGSPLLRPAVQGGMCWAGTPCLLCAPNVVAVYARLGACASSPGDHVMVC